MTSLVRLLLVRPTGLPVPTCMCVNGRCCWMRPLTAETGTLATRLETRDEEHSGSHSAIIADQ